MNSNAPLFRRILGDAFDALHEPLQRFHALEGHHRLQGHCSVRGADSSAARWLARALGLPPANPGCPLLFEHRTDIEGETWTRYFRDRTMRSVLREQPAGHLSECLGVVRLIFALDCRDGSLHMTLCGIHALGLRWPRRWLPEMWAREVGRGDSLQFDIGARLGALGLLVAYSGQLDLRSAEPVA